ncbi:hypothetical protein JHD49_05030, partial [Sulfurimonas sp. SAG-AH-194-C21]|nr:hypothetical protein [Sulfurimonas sp. SAG-AH-194-C21]
MALTPTIQNTYSFEELQKIQTLSPTAETWFGNSVSIDGDYAVIGADHDDTGATDVGAAYIFKRGADGNFTQIQKIQASDKQTLDYFGWSVAINGGYIVVGARGEDTGGADAGAAYVFKNNGSDVFTEVKIILATDKQAGDNFGFSVHLNGNYVVVGAAYEDAGGSNAGAAYIFENNSDAFTQVEKLTASNPSTDDQFGSSVAINGEYVVVASRLEDTGETNAGIAYIFKNDGNGAFSEVEILQASDAQASDYFGSSVAIEGNYVVVGASNEDTGVTDTGAVYIFKNDGSDVFTQVQKIQAGDRSNSELFGNSVSINGNYVLVGAVYDDGVASNAGAAYIFKNDGNDTFTQTSKIQSTDGETGDIFGMSVSISNGTVLVGASYESTGGLKAGAAYFFSSYLQANDFIENSTNSVFDTNATNATGYALSGDDAALFDINSSGVVTFKNSPDYETPLDVDTNNKYVFNVIAIGDVNTTQELRVNVLNQVAEVHNSYSFEELQKIQAGTPAASAYFGTSVDIDGDYAVVGARGETTDAGAAYVYKRGVDGNFTLLHRIVGDTVSANERFGTAVAIQGEYVVIGVRLDNAGGDDLGSIYIFKNDGSDTFTQVQYIQAADKQDFDYFGTSVDISGDYIVVGANGEDTKGASAGAAYVFKNNNGTFSQVEKLMASNAGADDYFGDSVAIDGEYIVVGAWGEDTGLGDAGMVYVFKNTSGSFVEVDTIQASAVLSADYFARSVDIDGAYIVVGAKGENTGASNAGATYIYKNDGSDAFTQIQKIKASDIHTNANFGWDVVLSGKYLVVGASRVTGNGYGSGAAYLFENDGSDVFIQTSKIQASDAQYADYFGDAVAISNGTILIGADYEDSGGAEAGSAYFYTSYVEANFAENSTGVVVDINATNATAYTLSGDDAGLFDINNSGVVTFKASVDYANPKDLDTNNVYEVNVVISAEEKTQAIKVNVTDIVSELQGSYTLSELQKIQAATPASSAYFGSSVDIDGDYAVIGAWGENTNQGAIYIYKRGIDGNFTQTQRLQASDAQNDDRFGDKVAIDGKYVVVGAFFEDEGGTDAGAAYIFKRASDGNFSEIQKILSADKAASDFFGSSVDVSGEYVVVGARAEDAGGTDAGAAYVFKNYNDTFVEVQKIVAVTPNASDNFGDVVAIDGDFIVVGAKNEDLGLSNSGAVHIFQNIGGAFAEIQVIQATSREASAYFGASVDIDGDYVVVGSPYHDLGSTTVTDAGTAFVFKKGSDGVFTQTQRLDANASREVSALFGISVSISGEHIAVGAYKEDAGVSDAGVTYVFKNDGSGTFSLFKTMQASDREATDYFGNAVAIYNGTVLIGANYEDTGATSAGAAYFFTPLYDTYFSNDGGSNDGGGFSITLTPNENQSALTTIVTVGLTGTISYTLGGVDAGDFSIDSSGVITFNANPDYEVKSSYTVTVTAADGTNTITQTITVNVKDVNDAPTFTSNTATSATEYTPHSYTPTGNDVDGDRLTLSVTNGTTLPSWLSFSAEATVSTFAGSGIKGSTDANTTLASFNGPSGTAVDSNGNVYVADVLNYKIRKITPAGVVTTFAGSGARGSTDATGTAASFYFPYDV